MTEFVHLHNHTSFSLLDGACRIPEMIKKAKKDKMKAFSITDHGNMFGAVSFYNLMKDSGLKPIIGLEAYIAPQSRLDRSSRGLNDVTSYHLILLAKNNKGYKNLLKLTSIGYLEGFYYKPRIDKQVLEKYSEGLIVMSSCIKGEIPYKIIKGDYNGALKAAGYYKDLFGEDFYLELQNHGLNEEQIAIKGLLTLSKELDIPIVATNDTHYLQKEDAEAHDVLLCIQTNQDRDDKSRLKFSSDQLYFKSPAEMAEVFRDLPEALKNTLEVSEKCNVNLDVDTPYMPKFTIPEQEEASNLEEYLKKKSWEGLQERYPEVTPELKERLEHELTIINDMGYAGYFLIVKDFIDTAKKHLIPVGPGRGSAAGSLVSYTLGITDVDPMRFGLLFERFLNPERVNMPDIDIDFCYEKRDQVIDYVKQKYGKDNVTQIITFGRMNARAVIRDVGRVLKIPYGEVDRIAKLIPVNTDLKTTLENVPDFKNIYDKDEIHRELIDISLVLEGLARHASTHAAGVVIAPDKLMEFVPLYKPPKGEVTTQYAMKSLEKVGLLKMDFLGLRTLTVIEHTLKAINNKQHNIDFSSISFDDEDTYKIFSRGETIGVFQFESSGMREYLKKLQPESIEDLIAMNALYRPGPMEWIDDFIARSKGKKKVEYLHPDLEEILDETHGIIVYQEQVMQIASKLANFNLGKADVLRRAMGKKSKKLMREQGNAFLEGAKQNNIKEEKAKRIFDLIKKFAGYGFNKSHATCYSVVAYQTAYLKAHYPREFMAANLTSEMGNSDRVVVLINECKRMGIEVLPPDVNESMANFIVSGENIRFGLGAVKNVGLAAIESIVATRDKEGKFKTIFDFCRRVNLRLINKKVLESLIQVGAMDSVEGNRAQKMAVVGRSLSMGQAFQQENAASQTTIFDNADLSRQVAIQLPRVEDWSESVKLTKEKELLGIYISGHPLLKYEDEVNTFANPEIAKLSEIKTNRKVRLCGIINNTSLRFDRNKNQMAFFMLEDFTGSVRIIVFSKVYEEYKNIIQDENMVVVLGNTDVSGEGGSVSILADEIIPVEYARERFARQLSLALTPGNIEEAEVKEILSLFARYPGNCPVFINIKSDNGSDFLLKSKRYKINPTPEVLEGLRGVLGKENVWLEG
ncbi:MAG: DNA polymerase III subunit alpha [bacterium]